MVLPFSTARHARGRAIRSRRWLSIALALAVAGPIAASSQQRGVEPGTGGPTGPRTGMIIGQVLDSTGAPVPEAIVQMSMPRFAYLNLPDTPKGRVMADDQGRFFFTDLPAGDFYLRASKDGYGGGEWAQRRPTGSGRVLTLTEGEKLLDAKLTVWKYSVIGGTVLDEAGEPVIGVTVYALARKIDAGHTVFGNPDLAYLTPSTTTDDRGMFRLAQLMPDRYVIAVPSTQTTMPIALLTASQDTALRNEMSAAIAEMGLLGQPRTQQIGDVALLTLNRVLIPPPPSTSGRMQVYKTMFFPAATSAGAATTIAIGAGEERTDLRITLRPVPAVKITGRLVTPDGSAPPPTSLRLVGESAVQAGDEGFETVTAMSDASGRFTMLGVPAGEYTLKSGSRLALFGLQGRQGWWVAQHVTIAGSDVLNMTVAARPAIRVEGRHEYLPATASPAPVPAPVRVIGPVFETPNGEPGRFAAQNPKQDRTFSTIAAGGRYIARVYERDGWFLKSVTIDGRDVTDRAFDLDADATNIIVTYTDRVSKISGVVKDARGVVSTTAEVLAFPIDPQRWSNYGNNPRQLKIVDASRTGAYSLEGLPAGEYHVIAIDDADADGWTDLKTLEALARMATKVTVADGDTKTVDLVLKAIR